MPISAEQELFFNQSDLNLTEIELDQLSQMRHLIGVQCKLRSRLWGPGDYAIWTGRVRRNVNTDALHLLCWHRSSTRERWKPPVRGMNMREYTLTPVEAS